MIAILAKKLECERNIGGRRNRSDNAIIQRIWPRSDGWCHIDVMRIFLFEISQFQGEAPLAETYQPLSLYLCCAANPLVMVDLPGREFRFVENTGNKSQQTSKEKENQKKK